MGKINQNSPERPRNAKKRIQKNVKCVEEQIKKEESPKVYHKDIAEEVKRRIARKKQKYDLPSHTEPVKRNVVSNCMVINIDGKSRELLPDKPGVHKILLHGKIAKLITSKMCLIHKITKSEVIENDIRKYIDGSYAISPCSPKMLNGTTVQHLKKRKLWFLKKYWYEINYDGRVQPSVHFYDYGIDPTAKRQRFCLSNDIFSVKDKEENIIRFWLTKPSKI
jgi:hypothetical protein